MNRLLLVRHAQSVWNASGRWQGWSDAPLSPVGEQQARRAGAVLASLGGRPGVVACSDLARARRTAELVAAAIGYSQPLVIDADLREQDLGAWNGLTRDEIIAGWPAELESRRNGDLGTVPGGEPGDHFRRRATGAVHRVAALGAAEALVVTHAGVVSVLEQALGVWGEGPRHTNLSGWWLESRGTPPDLALVPLAPLDLLAENAETVTGPA